MKGIVRETTKNGIQPLLHYYEIAKYSRILTGISNISNGSEIDII
jgi:hypothetical protein